MHGERASRRVKDGRDRGDDTVTRISHTALGYLYNKYNGQTDTGSSIYLQQPETAGAAYTGLHLSKEILMPAN